jgi:UDP:flavonoid glycosyltransferase YjiC (YdhE family)
MGGIPTAIDFDSWPRLDGIRVISGSSDRPGHPDVTCWLDLGLPFIDILASCDAAIIKPGYGLFVESACNGIPILYIPRDEWPETPAEVKWLERNAVGRCISEAQLRAGNISEAIGSLISAERRPIPIASGIAEIVDLISQRI